MNFGDLREGCLKNDLIEILKKSLLLSNIKVYGIGVNLSCFGEILPDENNMRELENLVISLEQKFNFKFDVISGGNSSSFLMLNSGNLPVSINNLRFGESIFLGNVPCFEKKIEGLHYDNFILEVQIIEIKEKPSVPWGMVGKYNSFGESVCFVDNGIRKRAIVALGKQDIRLNSITPLDNNIIVLGGSSDHIILDVTDSSYNYKLGDIIKFRLNYSGVLSCMASDFIEKEIVR